MSKLFPLLFFSLTATALAGQTFPADWLGKWTGDLEIWRGNRQVNTVPMSLEIQPLDTAWTFVITYQAGTAAPDLRNYLLVAVDDAAGHYAIDEKNGIVLDVYLFDNCLYDRFSLMGSDLFSRMCRLGETLVYEIISGNTEPARISGDTIMGADTIPPVSSYGLLNLTKAVLSKER